MGNKKPQTRVVAEINGDLRKLLSVRELSDDRLIITVPSNVRVFEMNNPSEKRVAIQQKFTVHHSRDSSDGGSLIHQTQTLDDGKTVEVHCYTHAFRNSAFQPVFGTIMAQTDEAWNLKPAPRDRIVNVGRIDQRHASLVYVVVLSQQPLPVSTQSTRQFETVRVSFRRFQMDIIVAGSLVPSFQSGFFGHMATSTPIVPFGPGAPEVPRAPSLGVSKEDLQQWAIPGLADLINLHASQAIARFGEPYSDMLRTFAGFGPVALPQIEEFYEANREILDGFSAVFPSGKFVNQP